MKTRLQIIKEARRIRDECQQIIIDCEHWNRSNPTVKPIDPDPDGSLKKRITEMEALLSNEIRISEPKKYG